MSVDRTVSRCIGSPWRRNKHSVRFGSLAALSGQFSPMSGSGGKADVFRIDFGSLKFNVCFSTKRTLLANRNSIFQGPLSARSGHCELKSRNRSALTLSVNFAQKISQLRLFTITQTQPKSDLYHVHTLRAMHTELDDT